MHVRFLFDEIVLDFWILQLNKAFARILLELTIRNCNKFQVSATEDVEKIINWENSAPNHVEIHTVQPVLLSAGTISNFDG